MFFILLIFLPSIIFSCIAFDIPKSFLGLYTSWITLFIILLYAEVAKIPGEGDYGILLKVLVFNALVFYICIISRVTAVQSRQEINHVDSQIRIETSSILLNLKYFTFSIYGFITSYLLTLFNGDLLAGLQPAWIVYLIALAGIIVVASIPNFIPLNKFKHKRIIKKCFQFYACSFSVAMLCLVVFSLSWTNTIIQKTDRAIDNYTNTVPAYCIQMVDFNFKWKKGYKSITTLLDLSPLTMRSKAPLNTWYGWGDPYFHSLLVVKNENSVDLYNWSYKEKEWSYLEPGFAERASIDEPEIVCTPQKNYLTTIPWIFPQNKLDLLHE